MPLIIWLSLLALCGSLATAAADGALDLDCSEAAVGPSRGTGRSLACAVRALLPLWQAEGQAVVAETEAQAQTLRNAEPYSTPPTTGVQAQSAYIEGIEGTRTRSCSALGNICSGLSRPSDRRRVGCCRPAEVRVLHNVRLSLSSVELFRGASAAAAADGTIVELGAASAADASAVEAVATTAQSMVGSASGSKAGACPLFHPGLLPKLPGLTAVRGQQRLKRWAPPLVLRNGPFSDACPAGAVSVGTLHVIAPHTPTNVFHFLNDNFLPFFSMVALDAVAAPQWAGQPRALLWDPAHAAGGFRGQPTATVAHMQWLYDATRAFNTSASAAASGFNSASAGGSSGGDDSGVQCYQRVIFGAGTRLLYNHVSTSLRRMAAQLLREFIRREYQPALPAEFGEEAAAAAGASAEGSGSALRPSWSDAGFNFNSSALTRHDAAGASGQAKARPLRVVLFSRGTRGSSGRILRGEDKLAAALRQCGAAVVVHSMEAGLSLKQQTEQVFHADVIMGIHGAGLTHAVLAPPGVIVVELKTPYAWGVDLFLLAADAAKGTHVHIDLGKTWQVDAPLIRRVLAALRVAEQQRSLPPTSPTPLVAVPGSLSGGTGGNGTGGDTVYSADGSHNIDPHPLGAPAAAVRSQCALSDFTAYRKVLGSPLSCKACDNN